ncbi:MAG: (d)CMP kinase [Armatimonadetes bacterium]|nr:(d)CMP kinase [Armatimonadota bacterium]
MNSTIVIAIDGPAGAGKSTVAKILAARLGLRYLDTGAMYRAIALKATRAGLGPSQGDEAALLAQDAKIEFGEGAQVLLNGEDVTDAIRTPEMGDLASALSAHSAVRAVLANRQKAIVAAGGYTLEGRDTTTVVAPDATLKIFLTASLEERSQRRLKELQERGIELDAQELAKQISDRDHRDYTRADSPLTRDPSAIVIETYGKTVEQVADEIISHLQP